MLSTAKNFFYVFVLSLLTFTTINAQLAGSWPQLDKAPPAKGEWTSLVDISKVPNAPVVKTPGNCDGTTQSFCNWTCNQCVRNETDITFCPNKPDWGLTFDDGPTPYTDGLLDYLLSVNTTLTFFVVGSRVVENPQILQKAVKAGHQIGVHTWSHPYLTTQTNEEIISEIKWTELAIKTAIGVTPKYMRPPYGDVDDRVRGILSQLGYKIVIWDKDTNDWIAGDNPKSFDLAWVEGNFTEWVKENDPTGHISLEHDLYQQTAAQGPKVVQIVQGAGFTIKPVALCVGDTNPYLESTDVTTTPTIASATAPTVDSTTTSTSTSTPEPTGQEQYNDEPTSTPTSTSDTSNAISHTKNNYYLFSLVFLIVSFFII